MAEIKNGGPAFSQGSAVGDISKMDGGMSLRDWFAGMALLGLISNPNNSGSANEATQIAFGTADAMLKAREASNA